MTTRLLSLLLGLAVIVAMGCANQPAASGKPTVFVSVPPLAEMVEQIGGDAIAVEVLVGPGQSPHTFEPTPQQMAALSEAAVFFRIGIPFEEVLLDKIDGTASGMQVVDLRRGLDLIHSQTEEGESDAHDHDHGEADPHVWLDPGLMKVMAATVREALESAGLGQSDHLQQRYERYIAGLGSLDFAIRNFLSDVDSRDMYVFHPAFGYFARAYGLHQIAVEREGKEPSGQALSEFIEHARAAGVRGMFTQVQHNMPSARTIADAVGCRLQPLDPLARDYLSNMRSMAQAIAAGLKEQGPR